MTCSKTGPQVQMHNNTGWRRRSRCSELTLHAYVGLRESWVLVLPRTKSSSAPTTALNRPLLVGKNIRELKGSVPRGWLPLPSTPELRCDVLSTDWYLIRVWTMQVRRPLPSYLKAETYDTCIRTVLFPNTYTFQPTMLTPRHCWGTRSSWWRAG